MPAQTPIQTKRYDKFCGVDFSTDPAKIADSRSPHAVNLISDEGGYPEKRVGWRTLVSIPQDDGKAAIHGIFRYFTDKEQCFLVHAGSKLYRWNGGQDAPVLLLSDVKDAKSAALMGKKGLFLLTGKEYLLFDGKKVQKPIEFGYVPIVVQGATNIVQQRGGEDYQPVNLITPRRKIHFHIYKEDFDPAQRADRHRLFLQTSIDPGTKVITRLIATGQELTPPYLIDYETGALTYEESLPFALDNGDNIEVEFSHTTKGHLDKIQKCTILTNFASRVFFTGNPEEPNCDWYCQLNDPTYISDKNYTRIGAADTAILGYARIGEQLAILKQGGDQDAAVFLRSMQTNGKDVFFPVKQGIPNDGLLAPKSIAMLLDDPLFLTRSGVQAISSKLITAERIVEMRSSRILSYLRREKCPEEAVACVWNGYYLLFLNGHVYVADSRQKGYLRPASESFEYEWYYWEGIPARVVCACEGTAYFGTEDGRLCRFNTDRIHPRGGYRMDAYNDDGAPIVAEWATKFDDDGDFGRLKSLRRRGSGVHIKNYEASGLQLIVRTDRDFGTKIQSVRRGIFDFQHIDFTNFTFNTQPFAFVPFGRKVKDYRLIQVICRNDAVNQGFGIYAIERRFVRGGFAK